MPATHLQAAFWNHLPSRRKDRKRKRLSEGIENNKDNKETILPLEGSDKNSMALSAGIPKDSVVEPSAEHPTSTSSDQDATSMPSSVSSNCLRHELHEAQRALQEAQTQCQEYKRKYSKLKRDYRRWYQYLEKEWIPRQQHQGKQQQQERSSATVPRIDVSPERKTPLRDRTNVPAATVTPWTTSRCNDANTLVDDSVLPRRLALQQEPPQGLQIELINDGDLSQALCPDDDTQKLQSEMPGRHETVVDPSQALLSQETLDSSPEVVPSKEFDSTPTLERIDTAPCGHVPYKYQEVVRCRDARRALPAHTCDECEKFVNLICQGVGAEIFDRKQLVDCSRHRAQHSPNLTPEGFWELSFADEIEARKRNPK